MRTRPSSIVLIGLLAAGCGGAQTHDSTRPGTATAETGPSASIALEDSSGTVDARRFDDFSSMFFNQSVEGVALSAGERAAMEHIGLDPSSDDDHQLLAFVVRGFHYRYYARDVDGDRGDLGVYVYNLDSVRVGQPIAILDLSPLEGIATEEIGGTLHDLFDPIRESREPRAIVAYAKSRANEPAWRRLFINAFAEDVEFATSGSFRITRAVGPSGEVDLVTHPSHELRRLEFSFQGERLGRRWRVEQEGIPLELSGS
jgi:hypothetical protein